MSTSAVFPPDHHHHHHHLSPSDHLCYVHCTFCDTALAVSVPYSSLFMRSSVMVRCGHCTNLLSLPITLPPPSPNYHLPNTFSPQNLLEETARTSPSSLLINQPSPNGSLLPAAVRGFDDLPKPPVTNRPPEKRQRVPSAYNRFIKEEIQRIKAGNPDISHREAFSAAAKNWAHFPHIHFGLMPDQSVKKTNVCQQEGDGFLAAAGVTNVGASPYY